MMNFPSSPSVGQTFINGVTKYTWDGTLWDASELDTALPFNYCCNPAFSISQQNGNTAQTVSGSYPADCWWFGCGGAVVPTFQRVQVTSPNGSPNKLRCTITTPDASLTTTDHTHLMQRIEATRFAQIGWHNVNFARPIVVRFWFKAPAGTYSFNIRNLNATTDTCYITLFTITAAQANVDTPIVLAIPVPPSGTWLAANDTSFACQFSVGLAFGPTYQSASLGWQTGSVYSTAAATNGIANAGTVYEFSDFGLYQDPLGTGRAPPWEYVPDRQVLFDVQRFWQRVGTMIGVALATTASPGRAVYPQIVPMRVAPTGALVGTMRAWDQATAPNISAFSATFSNTYVTEHNFTCASAQTAGRACMIIDGNGSTISITENARL